MADRGNSERRAEQTSSRSFFDLASERLDALTEAAGLNAGERARSCDVLDDLLAPWGRGPIGSRPRMACDIADDHFPIELSLALHASGAEARVLFEARDEGASMAARWRAGQRLNERLAQDYGVSLERLRAVEDLFAPRDPAARWAMWHSVCYRAGQAPKIKIYLNPQAQGPARASATVAEAMRRLGFENVVPLLAAGHRGDEHRFFSLDLAASETARSKVYKVHHDASRADVEAELALASARAPEALDRFWTIIACDDGPFTGLPMSTYLSLRAGDGVPSAATLHFPVRSYVDTDATVQARVRRYLSEPERRVYDRALEAFAARPLEAGVGMHAYVSIGLEGGSPRTTIYLALEGYQVAPPRAIGRRAPQGDRAPHAQAGG
jgi:DMATS type aromatic prenyltransferase